MAASGCSSSRDFQVCSRETWGRLAWARSGGPGHGAGGGPERTSGCRVSPPPPPLRAPAREEGWDTGGGRGRPRYRGNAGKLEGAGPIPLGRSTPPQYPPQKNPNPQTKPFFHSPRTRHAAFLQLRLWYGLCLSKRN